MSSGSRTVDFLERSGLLGPDQQAEARRLSSSGLPGEAIVRHLRERGWLTTYQAEQVLAGNGDGLVLGTRLLLEKLGEGAMGQVFKARHRRLDRIEAVKLIHPDRLDRPDAVDRFRREARAAARLSHPHVVSVHDADETRGVHFLVMEYVAGCDLHRWARRQGPLPPGLACLLLRQAALGLAHAHERGLIHRDVKPGNMIVADLPDPATGQPVLKVSDLGLARILPRPGETGEGTFGTTDRTPLGTPDYIAPEQILDFHEVDGRADVYGLGCTLYYLLAGSPPFPGRTRGEKLQGHLSGTPRPLEELRPDLPPGLGDVVRRMMARDPDRRFAGAAEVAAALAPFAQAERPTSTVISPAASEASQETLTETSRLSGRGRSPFRPVPIILAAVLFLGSVALYFRPWQADSDSPSPFVEEKKETGALGPSGLPPGSGVVEFRKTLKSVVCAEVVPGTGRVLAGGYPDSVVLVDPSDPGKQKEYPHDSVVMSLAVSPDGMSFLSGEYEEKVRWWRIDEKEPRFVMTGHKGYVNGVGLSSSLNLGISGGNDGIVRVWDLKTGKAKRELRSHAEPIYAVAVSPDGYWAATGGGGDWIKNKLIGKDFDVRLWDLRNLQEERRYPVRASVKALAFSTDGKLVLSGDYDQVVRVWDRDSGREICRYEGHEGYIFAIAASPDGRHVASGGDGGALHLWKLPEDPAEGTRTVRSPDHRFEGHRDHVRSLRFYEGGKRLLSASEDGTVRWWDSQEEKAR